MTAPAIRRVGTAHAEVLAALHAACFAEAWSAPFIALLLAQPGGGALLAADAADSSDAAGMALFRIVAGEAELLSIGVLPEARSRGLGRALLGAALADAAREGAGAMFLEMAIDNGPACALYHRAGFAPVGRRAGYYRRPEGAPVDALVLRRILSSETGPAGDCFEGPKGTQ